jgi:hypothetical protein
VRCVQWDALQEPPQAILIRDDDEQVRTRGLFKLARHFDPWAHQCRALEATAQNVLSLRRQHLDAVIPMVRQVVK